MKMISKKKRLIPIQDGLFGYLKKHDRLLALDIEYSDLLRFSNSTTLYDKYGEDSLWISVAYNPTEKREIDEALLGIYAALRSEGDRSIMEHLIVDRIDLCLYGNTRPFRVRIFNTLNENFDYFYVKNADASRVIGLELEYILSPNHMSFFVSGSTIIEEHIYGIPGDIFIQHYMDKNLNETRLAKEFVKFNERCFISLLGDMHASNYVIDITIDIEENMYRIRAVDFDQEAFEGRRQVYLPQYYKENNPIVNLGIKHLTWESVRQYQHEERALMHKRLMTARYRYNDFMESIADCELAPMDNVKQLRSELADFYQNKDFTKCDTMGKIIHKSLGLLDNRKNYDKLPIPGNS